MHTSKMREWYVQATILSLMTFTLGLAVLVYGRVTPPHVTHLGIEDGVIELRFNRIPDKGLVEASFALMPTVNGQVRWQGDTLRFFPSTPLPDGSPINVQIGVLADHENAPRGSFSRDISLSTPRIVAKEGASAHLLQGSGAQMLGETTIISTAKDSVLLVNEGRIELFRPSCNCRELVQEAGGGWSLRDALLSPDGRYVVLHQTQAASREGVGQVRLWLYDTRTKKRDAFWEQNSIPDGIWVTPEGSGIIVREASRMTFLPFQAGKGEIAFLGTFDRLLSMTPRGDALLFLEETENQQKLMIVQHQKDPQEIITPGVIIEQAEISPDLSTIYMLVRDANTIDSPSVRRYVLTHLLFNDTRAVLTDDPLWSATDIALSRDGRQLAVGLSRPSEGDGPSELRVLDLSAPQGILQKALHTGMSAWSDIHWLYEN